MSQLYAWANPLSDAPMFDHTWVTDYTPNQSSRPTGSNYWYCWGKFHSTAGNGEIGQMTGDLSMAKSLVEPNVEPANLPGQIGSPQDGSITYYAVDGVCHNVANQVLYATGTSEVEPLRVQKAKGYHISTFFYTNYGLNNSAWNTLVKQYAPNVKIPSDDFIQWMDKTLGDQISKTQLDELLLCRTAAQEGLEVLRSKVPNMTAHEVEAAVSAIFITAFDVVNKIIGPENFSLLFPSLESVPSSESEAMRWIDLDMLHKSFKCLQS